MGHHINAVLLKGPFDENLAKSFDLRPTRLPFDLTLFPTDACHLDYWSEKLKLEGFVSDIPLLNCKVVHHMVSTIALGSLFALVQTDYVGGTGSQAATVYRGDVEVMQPETTLVGPVKRSIGPINKALRLLGVKASRGLDEFMTIGLDRFRDFDELYEEYKEKLNQSN